LERKINEEDGRQAEFTLDELSLIEFNVVKDTVKPVTGSRDRRQDEPNNGRSQQEAGLILFIDYEAFKRQSGYSGGENKCWKSLIMLGF
jgi:hypothetical protein